MKSHANLRVKPRPLTQSDFRELHQIRNRFGPTFKKQKQHLLETCTQRSLTRPRTLLCYHDLLLFLCAYPESAKLRSLAESELERTTDAAASLIKRESHAATLQNSGLSHTTVEYSYSLDLMNWLHDRFPHDLEICWEDDSAGEALEAFLSHCTAKAERDGLLCPDLSTKEWIALAKGSNPKISDLSWLLSRLNQLPAPPESPTLRDSIIESLDLNLRWTLRHPGFSRTLLRLPDAPVYHHTVPIKHKFSLPRLLARPLPRTSILPLRQAEAAIDLARTTLAVRRRETDPFTYANPHEVTRITLERGVELLLYGMIPARRLPLESFFGYLLCKNGLPVGYGGGWVFGPRAEIGINIFDEYRGGESAYLFAQIIRTYHHHYAVSRFLVDPFQFGADNSEAIRTGAYWFYDRLGFRSTDPELQNLAASERTLIKKNPRHRTPAKILRLFTTAKIALDLNKNTSSQTLNLDLPQLGLAVTKSLAEHNPLNPTRAEAATIRRITKILTVKNSIFWPPEERDAFQNLCPLINLIPDLPTWPASQKQSLLTLMRAKGKPHERDYAKRVQQHPKLLPALYCPQSRSIGNGSAARPAAQS